MATTWTTTVQRASGYVVTFDTDWNEMVLDNLDYLYVHSPPVAYVGYAFVGTSRLPDASGI